VKEMLLNCTKVQFDDAIAILQQLWADGYAPTDIIATIFKVLKTMDLPEYLKLEWMKV
jgi:replication factor C subunit 2/4